MEAKLSKGKGPLATVLIREGKLKISDIVVCGAYWGRVRAMYDDWGREVKEAFPSCPVEILGLNGVPQPADTLFVVPDEETAKEIVRKKEEEKKKEMPPVHMRLEDLYKKVKKKETQELKLILKADVGGTLEAVESSLRKFSTDEVKISIVHKGVGAVTSSDVLLAEVTDAVILGFRVTVDSQTKNLAKQKGVEIRIYQIIYELINEVKLALEGMLTPEIRRIFLGRAKVKKVFKLSRATIAGCIVEKGKVVRGAKCELIRNNEVIFKGSIVSLKRFKDDVKEVTEGQECGINIEYKDIKEEDIIDVFLEEKIKRKL